LVGYRVDHIPQQYAIMQTDAGSLGHVAFVESVEPDGSWTISEMNVVGWDILSSRTFKAVQA
jgi:surface antigen